MLRVMGRVMTRINLRVRVRVRNLPALAEAPCGTFDTFEARTAHTLRSRIAGGPRGLSKVPLPADAFGGVCRTTLLPIQRCSGCTGYGQGGHG